METGEATWRQDSSSPERMSLRCLNFLSRALHRRNVLDQLKENLGPHEVSLFRTLATEHGNTRAGTYARVGQLQIFSEIRRLLSLAQILFRMNLTHL